MLEISQNRSNFPGNLIQNLVRTHKIFQEKEIPKNRSNFPEELSQNFVRTDTIFQETILPPRTDIL